MTEDQPAKQEQVLQIAVEKLKIHVSTERKGFGSILVDRALFGTLKLIEIIIEEMKKEKSRRGRVLQLVRENQFIDLVF